MRILELLALFRELFTNELRALLHALPTALDTFRDALLATFDACVGLFTREDPPVRCKSRRRCCLPTETAVDTDDAALLFPPPSPGPLADEASFLERPMNTQDMKDSLQAAGVDLDRVQQQLGRMDDINSLTLEDERWALAADVARQLQSHFAAVADDLNELQSVDPLVREDEEVELEDTSICDDDDASLHVSAAARADDPQGIVSGPPSLALSDFNEDIPRVPGVARQLPPGWNTDWTVNSYMPIRPASDVASEDNASVLSEPTMPRSTGAPSSSMSVGEIAATTEQLPLPDLDEPEREPELADTVKPDEPVAADIVEEPVNSVIEVSEFVSSPPHSGSSRVSSWRSTIPTGVSYRQLTLELAPDADEEDSASRFYRAALQKLKQERELRQRLRAESMNAPAVVPSTPVVALSPLRAMRVIPLIPEYEDETMRLARKQKLDELRQRTTTFRIKIGEPLGASLSPEAI